MNIPPYLYFILLFPGFSYAKNCDELLRDTLNEKLPITKQHENALKYEICIAQTPIIYPRKSMRINTPPPEPQAMTTVPTANSSDISSNSSATKGGLTEPEKAAKTAQAKALVQDRSGKMSFMGQNFGIGFGVSLYDEDIIDNASIVNGKVVVNSRRREEARILLEFHTIVGCNKGGTNGDFGCGPFAAIAAKENDILGGIGLGWLWSWRNKNTNDGSGFSVGIGAIVDNKVKSLADGFKVGEVPPEGETAIRYTEESKISYLLFISNNF